MPEGGVPEQAVSEDSGPANHRGRKGGGHRSQGLDGGSPIGAVEVGRWEAAISCVRPLVFLRNMPKGAAPFSCPLPGLCQKKARCRRDFRRDGSQVVMLSTDDLSCLGRFAVGCMMPQYSRLGRNILPCAGACHRQLHTVGTLRVGLLSLDWRRDKDPPLALGHAAIKASLLTRFGPDDIHVKDWAFNVKDAKDPDNFTNEVSASGSLGKARTD
jgi:hypothetical protein